jgi:hypothetical protein
MELVIVCISLCSLCIYYGIITHIMNGCIDSDEAWVYVDCGSVTRTYWLIC